MDLCGLPQYVSNWTTISSPVRTCGRGRTSSIGCNSAFYSTLGLTYSRVCGRIIAYQDATPDAFHATLTSSVVIDGPYVDGVSLTHGSVGSRQHIWTFASAIAETDNYVQTVLCSCSNNLAWPYSMNFVGNDYFCDSGNRATTHIPLSLYSNDPLWDGHGCGHPSTCCQFHGFVRPSPSPPLMTWRSGSAIMVIMKTHLSNYSSFMCSIYIIHLCLPLYFSHIT